MAKAAFFSAQLKVFADRALSPAAQSAALAARAKARRDALIAEGRATPVYRRFTDGREGALEETVKPAPSGQIVYRFNHMGAVVTFALSFLVSRSPSRSGRFRKSFYVGVSTSGGMVPVASGPARGAGGRFVPSAPAQDAGGKFIPMERFNADALGPNVTEIVIGNTAPFSRKVDVQLAGNKELSFSVPPGLFDDAVKAIKARYGTLVDVRRVYTMNFPGQYILKREQYHQSGRRKGRARMRAGKRVESPAIIITPRS